MPTNVPSETAVRIEPTSGSREVMQFIGSGEHRMFSVLHAPAGPPHAGVVLCSSVLAELLADYTEEVLLSRRLAERGFMVRRFHYRGTGHSDGDAADVTLDTMASDAAEVARYLADEAQTEHIGFVGTRVGALVAATVAGGYPDAPLAVLDPALAGDRLLREVIRSRLIQQMKEHRKEQGSSEDILATVERDGQVDLLGYPLTRSFVRSVRDRKLIEELGDAVRPLLVVHLSKQKKLSATYQSFMDELAAKGFTAELTLIEDEIAWWFYDVRRHLIEQIADRIESWLVDRFALEASR